LILILNLTLPIRYDVILKKSKLQYAPEILITPNPLITALRFLLVTFLFEFVFYIEAFNL
jgi:hypothetical protein